MTSSNVTLATFLRTRSRGAYTVLRCGQALSDDLAAFHLSRLKCGTEAIFPHMEWRPVVAKAALARLSEARSLTPMDLLLLLVRAENQELVLDAHFAKAPLAEVVVPRILAVRFARGSPTIKDSAWVHDRTPLESMRDSAGAKEVVLLSAENTVLEGLVTNVFCVHRDGSLWTAPADSVLPGSTRQVVIREAKRLGIVVREEAVAIEALILKKEIRAVFLTSAVHMCTPVQRVCWNAAEIEVDSRNNLVVSSLRATVCAKFGLNLAPPVAL